MTNLEADKKGQRQGWLALPEWVKDYGAIVLVALFMFSAIWNYAQDKYFLQILCSIGVAIIVATALNLVVGYIGQVALGHAGFLAIGGYVTGLLLGRLNGYSNWIDYLYLRSKAAYSPEESSDYNKATAAREQALTNVNNNLTILLIVAAVLTIGLGLWFWLRWQHVKRTDGAFEKHFWHSPAVMRTLFYISAVGGGILTVVCYVLNLSSGLPSIITLLVFVLALVFSYLCRNQMRKMSSPNVALRPGFWDTPDSLKNIFLTTVVTGVIITVALAVFLFVGFWVLQNFWVALALGALVTGVFGWLLALPSLRVKGPYLSMVTIAFGLIVYQVVNSSALQPTLGSQNGLVQIPFPISERNARTQIIQQPTDNLAATNELFLTAMIILACALVTLYLIRNFVRSRWGRALIAVRENEIGAGSVGVNVTRMKTVAFVLSASLAGVGGVLNAYSFSFVGPSISQLDRSVAFVTMLILGGVGTLFGPVVGAIGITVLPEMLKNLQVNKVDTDVFSLVGNVTFFLLIGLLVVWFVVRQFKLEMPAARMAAGAVLALVGLGFGIPTTIAVANTIDVPVVAGTPNLFLQLFQWAAYLAGFVLVAWMVYYGYRNIQKKESAAFSLATTIGFVVVFNSIEILRAFFNSVGAATGVGFKKTNFGIDGWAIILLYFVFIIAGLFVTTGQMRKVMVRSFAAGAIMFIPEMYRLVIGLARNTDGSEFRPTEILLTIYGAILLYFLYLVPKGIGGLLGQFIEVYLPTKRTINYNVLRKGAQPASADGGIPDAVAVGPTLAFHRQRGAHDEVLRVARVTRDFKGLRAVDSVEMKLDRGDIHALIGPNGAGKTTVLNLISGLYPVSDGQILFKGERIDGLKSHQIATVGISRTFQNLQVFGDMTVLENVMVGFHLHTKQGFWASLLGLPQVKQEEERIKALSMQLLDFVGLGDRAYNKAKDLPYGYQRLLEIARALAVEPEILLLDEPAAGLNPQEIGDMDRLIRKIKNEGVTVLLIEHHMDLVMEISDEITVLDYGRKISEGLPSQVQSDQKVKDAYFGPEVVINARS
jgi:ABC-type branched-subunit amino acid transport system ATPase component/ABC-type branched-subunit amino acid transport system permease subunit